MIFISSNQEGAMNKFNGKESQDYVTTFRRGQIAAMCLCDGAGSYKRVREGAEATACCLSKLAVWQFSMITSMKDEELRSWLALNIAYLRQKMGTKGTDGSCTVLLAAIDSRTGRYLALHLGDGCVAVRRGREPFRQVTRPPKCEDRATFLTSSPLQDIEKHLQIARGVADEIFVSSDGVEGFLYGTDGEVSASLADIVNFAGVCPLETVRQGLQHIISQQWQPMDDCSIGILSRRRPDRQAMAAYMSPRPWLPPVKKRARRMDRFAQLSNEGLSPAAVAFRISGRRGAERMMQLGRAYGFI